MKLFTVVFLVLLTWMWSLPEQMHAQESKPEGDENPKPEPEASVIVEADEQLLTKAEDSEELQLLQGTWEGVQVGDEARITITINGNSLHFHRDKNFWFETAVTLSPGKAPKQLDATIKDCAEKGSIGEVVKAVYKIEDGTLILATLGDDAEGAPESFETSGARYDLRKIKPQEKNNEPPKTGAPSDLLDLNKLRPKQE